jgi:hypothetical protein
MFHNSASNLSISDSADFAAFMLQLMTTDQRAKMMAERPALYARLFPGVDADVIISQVRAQISSDRGGA